FELAEFENLGKSIHDIISIYPKAATSGKDAGVHSNRGMSLSGVVFEFCQAAVFDRLKMVLKRIARASLSRCAASLSLIAVACASSCSKEIPDLRNCLALSIDLSFS